jgi:hypothetical protein
MKLGSGNSNTKGSHKVKAVLDDLTNDVGSAKKHGGYKQY